MSDLIDRQAAYEVISEYYHHKTETQHKALREALEKVPSAQPTLYGYNIEHLEMIARVLQKEDLPPERVVEVLKDVGRIAAMVKDAKDELEEALRKAVEQCTI